MAPSTWLHNHILPVVSDHSPNGQTVELVTSSCQGMLNFQHYLVP